MTIREREPGDDDAEVGLYDEEGNRLVPLEEVLHRADIERRVNGTRVRVLSAEERARRAEVVLSKMKKASERGLDVALRSLEWTLQAMLNKERQRWRLLSEMGVASEDDAAYGRDLAGHIAKIRSARDALGRPADGEEG